MLCVNAWTSVRPSVSRLHILNKKMFCGLDHWTRDGYILAQSGAKNAELILLKKVVYFSLGTLGVA